MTRRGAILGIFLWFLTTSSCGNTADRKASQAPVAIRLAVGGAAQIVYLPTTLAQQLGHYRDEGLDVTIEDFPGGAKALQALLGGSADVVSGFFDHVVQMAAEGRELTSFITILRYPALAAVVSPRSSRRISRIEDLKGATVGVTAPGSGTHFFMNYLLIKHGLTPESISVTGIGGAGTALAAMERGKVDAAVMTDPALAQLAKRAGPVTILADTRTAAGVQSAFGVSSYPASVFYSKSEWLARNPDSGARLVRAMKRTLAWLQSHSPREIAGRMPESHRGGDADVYVEAIRASMPVFSPDGMMAPEGPLAVEKVLSASLPKVREAKVDVGRTYTNRFVEGR